MRTISQTFADMVFNNEDSKAQGYLKQYGLTKTSALTFLALKGHISPVWMDLFRNMISSSTSTQIGDALLLTLAVSTPWERRSIFVDWLAQNLDGEWHQRFKPIHHASFHGVPESFPILERAYLAAVGEAFNWNTLNSNGYPPFYLALLEGHLESVVHILQNGGNPHLMLPDSRNKGKQISVLDLVFQNKLNNLSYTQDIWEAARAKAAIQKSLGCDITESDTSKKNRKI